MPFGKKSRNSILLPNSLIQKREVYQLFSELGSRKLTKTKGITRIGLLTSVKRPDWTLSQLIKVKLIPIRILL